MRDQGGASGSARAETVELAPGRLRAHVYAAHVDGVPCWAYVSEGLWSLGQPELVVSLPRGRVAHGFPEAPLYYLHSVLEAAEGGWLVQAGDITEYAGEGPFGPQFTGVAYLRARPIAGVALPPRVLAALALTAAEVRVAGTAGVARVASRLGQQYGVFPWPSWSDLTRPGVFDERATAATMLAQVPVCRGYDNTVVQERGVVTVRLSFADRGWVDEAAQLPPEAPLAFTTTCDPNADACLVWQPGQQQATAIARPGSAGASLSGCFVAFVPGFEHDGVDPHEDGFVVRLTPASWAQVRGGLLAGTEGVLNGPHGVPLMRLRWTCKPDAASDETSPAYIDAYFASDGASWTTPSPTRVAGGPMVTLLMSEGRIAERVATEDLASFAQLVRQALVRVVPSLSDTTARELRLDLCIMPAAGMRLRIDARPPLIPDDERRIRDAVASCPPPPVIHGPALFQIVHPLFS